MKKQLNLDGLKALLTEQAAKARQAEQAAKARQAERVRTGHDSGDCAPFALNKFLYLQLADRLEDRIRKGEFGEDGKLPVTGELAEWYDVKGRRHQARAAGADAPEPGRVQAGAPSRACLETITDSKLVAPSVRRFVLPQPGSAAPSGHVSPARRPS